MHPILDGDQPGQEPPKIGTNEIAATRDVMSGIAIGRSTRSTQIRTVVAAIAAVNRQRFLETSRRPALRNVTTTRSLEVIHLPARRIIQFPDSQSKSGAAMPASTLRRLRGAENCSRASM